jgi:hypothetical protein
MVISYNIFSKLAYCSFKCLSRSSCFLMRSATFVLAISLNLAILTASSASLNFWAASSYASFSSAVCSFFSPSLASSFFSSLAPSLASSFLSSFFSPSLAAGAASLAAASFAGASLPSLAGSAAPPSSAGGASGPFDFFLREVNESFYFLLNNL